MIEINGTVEKSQRLVIGISARLRLARHAAQIVVVRIEAISRLALGSFDLGLIQYGR